MNKKEYKKPEIIHELNLETRAGSCKDDGSSHHCDDDLLSNLNPANLLNLER